MAVYVADLLESFLYGDAKLPVYYYDGSYGSWIISNMSHSLSVPSRSAFDTLMGEITLTPGNQIARRQKLHCFS